MGDWKTQIFEDDVVADIYADFIQRYDNGMAPAAIRRELEDEYANALEDQDDMPLFWFARAQAQWEIANLQPYVLEKVSGLIASGQGLERWQEANPAPRKRIHQAS